MRSLAEASGVETPTRADLARFDRSRKNKKTSNKEWKSPQDPDAKIAKMKDGRTHLAHKAEHGVDMDTGAIVSVTVQDASDGDTATLPETLIGAFDRPLGTSDARLGVQMDTDGARRLNRSSPSCLNRPAQQTDFFHGLLTALDKPYGFHVEIEIDPHVDIDRQSPYRRRLVVVRIDAYVSTPRLGGLEAWTSVSIVHRSPSGFDVELVEPFSRQGDKSHYQRLHDALQRWDATQERWKREMNS